MTFAAIAIEANPLVGQMRDRMPIMVEKAGWPLWLGDPATLPRPAAAWVPRFWPIDSRPGQVRNDGPHLIDPAEEMEPIRGIPPPIPAREG